MIPVNFPARLTKDPKLTKRGDIVVCDMRVASNGIGNDPTVFIDVSTFGKKAEADAKYLSKGSLVHVVGKLRFEEWESDGEKRSKYKVRGNFIQYLDPKPEAADEAEPADSESDGDDPSDEDQETVAEELAPAA